MLTCHLSKPHDQKPTQHYRAPHDRTLPEFRSFFLISHRLWVHNFEISNIFKSLFIYICSTLLYIVIYCHFHFFSASKFEMDERSEGRCTTPKRRECQIPVVLVCPPPPKKKTASGMKRDPPKNGYFHPPDLDALFTMPPRREAWA